MKLIALFIGLCVLYNQVDTASIGRIDDIPIQRVNELIGEGVDPDYLQSYGWLKTKMGDLIDRIKGTYRDFKEWAKKELGDLKEQMMPHVEAQMELAKKFLKTVAKSGSEAAIKAGYEYFKENQNEIGLDLWTKIDQLYREKIEKHFEYSSSFISEIPDARVIELIGQGVDPDYLQSYGWLKTKMGDLIDRIKGTYRDFKEWAKKELGDLKEQIMPHVEAQMELAKKFLKTVAKSGSEAAIKAGYEYFKENQNEIGLDLWTKIDQLYREKIEKHFEYSSSFISEIPDARVIELIGQGVDPDYLQSYGWLKTKMGDLIDRIKGTYRDFKEWAKKELGDLKEQIMPHVEAQMELAKKFLKTVAKSGSEAAIKAGYEYFKENQNEIGLDLWTKIDQLYREKIEKHFEYLM